jgi:protein-tyrosine phosphatase
MASSLRSSLAGFARRCFAVAKSVAYRHHGPDRIDWARVERWVFVCHGNICRSPFGEYWAKARGVPAVSCGLEGIAGKGADVDAIRFAAEFGVDLQPHAGAKFADFPLAASDLVICFEDVHLEYCRARVDDANAQMLLLGMALRPPSARIADPYGRGASGFTRAFRETSTALATLLAGPFDSLRSRRR